MGARGGKRKKKAANEETWAEVWLQWLRGGVGIHSPSCSIYPEPTASNRPWLRLWREHTLRRLGRVRCYGSAWRERGSVHCEAACGTPWRGEGNCVPNNSANSTAPYTNKVKPVLCSVAPFCSWKNYASAVVLGCTFHFLPFFKKMVLVVLHMGQKKCRQRNCEPWERQRDRATQEHERVTTKTDKQLTGTAKNKKATNTVSSMPMHSDFYTSATVCTVGGLRCQCALRQVRGHNLLALAIDNCYW